MALPRKLKGMNLFNNANSYQGVVTAVTLPKLARKLDPFRAGGMSGAAFIDNGLEDDALDMEWSIGGIDELVLTQWGASDIPLRLYRLLPARRWPCSLKTRNGQLLNRPVHWKRPGRQRQSCRRKPTACACRCSSSARRLTRRGFPPKA